MVSVGVVVSGSEVILAALRAEGDDTFVVEIDRTMRLSNDPRPEAYQLMYRQCHDFFRENNIDKVLIKGSAVSRSPATKALLESAELRGVVTAAAAATCQTRVLLKPVLSRRSGKRKVDEYVGDDDFWDERIVGSLRKGSREAALLVVASEE